MTEIHLQQMIKEILTKEILSKLSIFRKGEMQVFLQDIPLSTDFEGEDDKYFPCCIVKLIGGEIKDANKPQHTTVEIVIAIKDMDEDMTGHQALMVTIQRIRDYFTAHAGIEGKFRLLYPISWDINSDDFAAPYFVGSVTTKWETDIMPFSDPNNFL